MGAQEGFFFHEALFFGPEKWPSGETNSGLLKMRTRDRKSVLNAILFINYFISKFKKVVFSLSFY
jgi:hypothetical protein